MPAICLYFQVHQPFRTRVYDFIQIGNQHQYFDEEMNKHFIDRVAENCYLPANKLMLELITKYGRDFSIAFSITGTTLDQLEKWRPDVIKSFQQLSKTGQVEWLSETAAHSLSALYNRKEFRRQVKEHDAQIERLFGYKPRTFRNTELLFSNDLVNELVELGYNQLLVPSTERLLGIKSPNHVYKSPMHNKTLCLPKNSSLTAELTRWFGEPDHPGYPLTATKFAEKLMVLQEAPECVNLFMDYETIGEHKKAASGIFDFFRELPEAILALPDYHFLTPDEVFKKFSPAGKYDVPYPVTWSYPTYDLSYITGSDIQQEAINRLYDLAPRIYEKNDPVLLQDWSRLQSTDHFFYMTPRFEERGERNHFSPFASAYDAYNNFLNILIDLELRTK